MLSFRPTSPPPPPVFVGRERERRQLHAILAERSAVICGIAGVGKTALARVIAAEWQGPVIYRELTRASSCRDLAEPALWVIDGLHWLEPDAQRALLAAARRHDARVLATSRVRVDELALPSVMLDGLDEVSCRELWAHLDQLYGPAERFARAWLQSRGNPYLLRQAHLAPLDTDRPLDATWDALAEDERRVATLLAIGEASELDAPALRELARHMVVEVDGACRIHELFRAVVLARVPPARSERRPAPRPSAAGPRPRVPEPVRTAGASEVVIDMRQHTVRAGGHTIALGTSPLLRALLYAFAEAPGHELDKDALAHALWGRPFSAKVHEHSLKANVYRLRRLLRDTTLEIAIQARGYRLACRGRLLLVRG